jgi:hypothetical protein
MMFLLIVSGVTATVVGYRVKSADMQRKADLLKTYERLGGSFESAHQLGQSKANPDTPREQSVFISAYETNARARAYGLYRVLENTPAQQIDKAIESLFTIEATEAARSTQDAWRTFQEPVTSQPETKPTMNPKAARFARQYDRYLARDTEVKLYTYLRDHRQEIEGR